jgi:predicted nucleotidyltransferase
MLTLKKGTVVIMISGMDMYLDDKEKCKSDLDFIVDYLFSEYSELFSIMEFTDRLSNYTGREEKNMVIKL